LWQPSQALEAKEGVQIKKETIPTANITFQVFFRCAWMLAVWMRLLPGGRLSEGAAQACFLV